jgi:hypothetical protein
MTTPLLVLFGGFVFVAGFGLGVAVSRWALRQWEQRLRYKARAIESARRYLRRQGIDLPTWVVSIVDEERPVRQRRWWQRCRNGGKQDG